MDFCIPSTLRIFVVQSFFPIIWGKAHIRTWSLQNKVMMACPKKRMVDSAFTISGLLQNIRSIEDPSLKKWVNLSNEYILWWMLKSLILCQRFKFTSPAHYFLHVALKSPITIKQNVDVWYIFDHIKWTFWE